jgi:hypothetical protein
MANARVRAFSGARFRGCDEECSHPERDRLSLPRDRSEQFKGSEQFNTAAATNVNPIHIGS